MSLYVVFYTIMAISRPAEARTKAGRQADQAGGAGERARRQAGGQTDRQADRQAGRQADRYVGK